MEMKIGLLGPISPPYDYTVRIIKRIEEYGYDSAWWPDHWMGWTPDSIWTQDIFEVSAVLPNPHIFYDVFSVIGFASALTSKIQLGTAVTEAVRRHPAELAQASLTLHHLSKGRFILGLGTGEGENIIPYGLEWKNPVGRLKEAIILIRLFWSGKKFDYDGKFWKIKDAVMGLPSYEGKYPPIWVGAHREKMLKLVGELCDGWIPVPTTPEDYAEGFKVIRDAAKKAGRNPDEIVGSAYIPTIADEDHDECHRIFNSTAGKSYTVLAPPEMYKRFGYEHPLGFYAFKDYIPTRYGREEILQAIRKVPDELGEHYYLHGNSEDIIKKLEEYGKAGLQHAVIWNLTPLFDYKKTRSSFEVIRKVAEYFKK